MLGLPLHVDESSLSAPIPQVESWLGLFFHTFRMPDIIGQGEDTKHKTVYSKVSTSR